MEFKLADINIKEDLKKLFKISFFMSQEEVDFLLKNEIIEKCVVCLVDGQLVSALYMFDTYVLKNGQTIPSYYLYGAATFPEFRSKGYMRALIDFSNEIARKKGQKYSVLLPATGKLSFFYKKIGYKDFFKTRFVRIKGQELKILSRGGKKYNEEHSFAQMSDIRKMTFCENGDVLKDSKDIEFAAKYNTFYGGKTIFSEKGYAFCKAQKDTVLVTELAVSEEDFKNLIFNIYEEFGDAEYIFRLADDNTYFRGYGKSIFFGMIKSLDKNYSENDFKCNRAPYLGLTLD